MADKLKLKAGSKISADTILYEGYQKKDRQIIANVGIDKIEEVFLHFIAIHNEPLFFILELPAKSDDETEVKPGVVRTFHKNVYYIDGCTQEEALAILSRVGNLLYNDGLSSFGFGGHESNDEIMFGKGDIEKKESFQSSLLAFNNTEIKYNNSVYFDADSEIIKQLKIDVNCKNYDLAGIYKKNLSQFRKDVDENVVDRVDEFIQYPENGSLLYFAELEELKKRFDEYLVSETKEMQAKISELTVGVEPIVATAGETSPLIPVVVKGKVIHKTGGVPAQNRRKLADMGLRGEQCVYQLLCKDTKKQFVLWVSENAQKAGINPEGVAVLGYDMEYVDEQLGKCYVEVKASSSSLEEGIHFHMSENEYRFACEHSDRYFVYYVASVNDKHPKVVQLGDVFKNDEFNNSKYYLSAKEYYVSANYIPDQTSSI